MCGVKLNSYPLCSFLLNDGWMDAQLWMVRTTFFKWVVDGDEGSGGFKETSFQMMKHSKIERKVKCSL